MKSIEQIAKEFQEVVKGNIFSDTKRKLFYNDITGHYNNKYYNVVFMQSTFDSSEIYLTRNTDCVDEIVSIIKNIEPLAIIIAYKEIVTYERITL